MCQTLQQLLHTMATEPTVRERGREGERGGGVGVAGKNCIGANCHTSHKYVYFKEASITNSNGGGGES